MTLIPERRVCDYCKEQLPRITQAIADDFVSLKCIRQYSAPGKRILLSDMDFCDLQCLMEWLMKLTHIERKRKAA